MNKRLRVTIKYVLAVLAFLLFINGAYLGILGTWSLFMSSFAMVSIFGLNLVLNTFSDDYGTDLLLLLLFYLITLFSGLCVCTNIVNGNFVFAILGMISSFFIFLTNTFAGSCNGFPNFIRDIPKNWYKIGKFSSGSFIYNRATGDQYNEYSKFNHRVLLFAYIHARFLGMKKDLQTQKYDRFVQVGWTIKDLCK